MKFWPTLSLTSVALLLLMGEGQAQTLNKPLPQISLANILQEDIASGDIASENITPRDIASEELITENSELQKPLMAQTSSPSLEKDAEEEEAAIAPLPLKPFKPLDLSNAEIVPVSFEELSKPSQDAIAPSNISTTVSEGNLTPMAQGRSRRVRQNPNEPLTYVGVGINIGFTDSGSDLTDSAFVINSKLPLSSNVSFRPSILLGGASTFLFPITYDFAIQGSDPFEPSILYPFVGGGVVLTTEEEEVDNNNFGPLVSGGVDVLVSNNIVLNTAANLVFLNDKVEVGWMLGVGYRF